MNQILDIILTFSHLIHVRLEVSKYNLITNFNMKTDKSHTIHESNQLNHVGHGSSKHPDSFHVLQVNSTQLFFNNKAKHISLIP